MEYTVSPQLQEKFDAVQEAVFELSQIGSTLRDRQAELQRAREAQAEIEQQIARKEAGSISGKIAAIFRDGDIGKNLEKDLSSACDQIRLIEAKFKGLLLLEATAVARLPELQREFERARSTWAQDLMRANSEELRRDEERLVERLEFGLMLGAVCDDQFFSLMVSKIVLPDPVDGSKDMMMLIKKMFGGSDARDRYFSPTWDETKPAIAEVYQRLKGVRDLSYQLKKMIKKAEASEPVRVGAKVA